MSQTPRFFLGKLPGQVLVLEPRRLAARSFAGLVAALLDEFHERTLECDLALAWLKALLRATGCGGTGRRPRRARR